MTNFIQLSDGLAVYRAQINGFPLLTAEEEHGLAVRWHDHGDLEAAHKLVVSNLRFVMKIAFEYRGFVHRIMDLIQEGNIGLMTAVRKFDPHRGYRLISYAVWWIRAYIRRFIMSTWSMVKVGTTQVQRKLFYSLGRLHGADPDTHARDLHELAEQLGVRDAKVLETEARLALSDFSLEAETSEEGRTLRELLPSTEPTPEETLADREEHTVQSRKLQEALETLSPKERGIVGWRLLTEPPRTLEAIGQDLGVTKERVRQLEARALGKLRRVLESPDPRPLALPAADAATPA